MRLCWHTEGGKHIVFAFPPNRLGMHTFSGRSEKQSPPCSKRRCWKQSETTSCYTRGQRKVDRQKEVAPEREGRWPERGQEDGPRARRVKRDAGPAAQAQARQASSYDASVKPAAWKPKEVHPRILTSSKRNSRGSEETVREETPPNQRPKSRALARAQPSSHIPHHTSNNLARSPPGVSPMPRLPFKGCERRCALSPRL